MEHPGKCASDGFALHGEGPNCTFVGRRAWRWPTNEDTGGGVKPGVMIGGCARNVRAALETHTRAWIEAVLDRTAGGALIFEDQQRSGDPDGSRSALRAWATSDARVRLILSQPLLYPKWSRTQRIAMCRNMLAFEAAAHLPEAGVLVSVDLDCHPITPDRLASLVRAQAAVATVGPGADKGTAGLALVDVWTGAPLGTGWGDVHRWDVITANSPRQYYDRWALRSGRLGLDYDCWFNSTSKGRGK